MIPKNVKNHSLPCYWNHINSSKEKEATESDENVKIEKQEKTLGKQKAWEKSVPSHKVIQQDKQIKNTFENMLLVEQPSLT